MACARATAHPHQPVVLVLAQQPRCDAVAEVAVKAGLLVHSFTTTSDVLRRLQEMRRDGARLAAVVCALGTNQENSAWPLLAELRRQGRKQTFILMLSITVAKDAKLRLKCFEEGVNMISESLMAVEEAMKRISFISCSEGPYKCPTCSLEGLSEDALHRHMPFHHGMQPNVDAPCPICGDPCNQGLSMEVHVNNCHGPLELREPPSAPFAAFSWCVCRRQDGCFLLVHEPAGICGGKPRYWLPAGRVDRGESLANAACRECLEEAGVQVSVAGVIRFMVDGRGTLRVVFLVVPTSDTAEAKSIPDWESCGAMWAPVDQLGNLTEEDYRHPDPADLYPKVASGALQAHSIQTQAFQALEALIQQWTGGAERNPKEFQKVMRDLQKTYPASAFSR